MFKSKFFKIFLALVLVSGFAAHVNAQDNPMLLILPADELDFGYLPFGVTNDGSMVAGQDFMLSNSWYWTAEEGTVIIDDSCKIYDVSDDYVFGGDYKDWGTLNGQDMPIWKAAYAEDGVWTQVEGIIEPFSPINNTTAKGISTDGSTLVGMQWMTFGYVQAFAWTAETGMVGLGNPHPERSSKAMATNQDGTIVTGWAEENNGCRAAYSWTRNEDGTYDTNYLGTLSEDPVWPGGEPEGISDDGTKIVGSSGGQGFMWTEEGMIGLGWLDEHLQFPEPFSWGMDVSNTGTVAGFAAPSSMTHPSQRTAAIWTEESGFIALIDTLETLGFNAPHGYAFNNILDISADGTIMTGYAVSPDGFYVPFLVNMNAPEPTGPPADLAAVLEDEVNVSLTWSNTAQWTNTYLIERQHNDGSGNWSDWVSIDEISVNILNYQDNTIGEPGLYRYRVCNANGAGNSDWIISNEISIAGIPEEPSDFTAGLNLADESVDLSWTDNSDEEEGFRLEYRYQMEDLSWSNWQLVEVLPANTTEYSHQIQNWETINNYRIRSENIMGESSWVETEVDVTDVDEFISSLPVSTEITSAYPNPFNGRTTVKFNLHKSSEVKISLFSVTGQIVQELLTKNYSAGEHQTTLNLDHLSSGTYFLRLSANGSSQSHKLLLIK